MEPVHLTAKMRYALLCFASVEQLTTIDIAKKAAHEGINRTQSKLEWADAPVRQLRVAGLIEYAGGRRDDRRLHELTQAGREALARAQQS